MASSVETNKILRFFTRQPTPKPTLGTVLSWSDDKLEAKHDYIQLLFPLPEASMIMPAPLITAEVFHAFRSGAARSELQGNLRLAFARMMAFYGFEVSDAADARAGVRGRPLRLQPAADHAARFRTWVRRFNHNHLRLTRILRSLRVLGLAAEAAALHAALEALAASPAGRALGATSRLYWARAATRPLYLAPDDADDGPRAPRPFLEQFERERRQARDSADGQAVEEEVTADGAAAEAGEEEEEAAAVDAAVEKETAAADAAGEGDRAEPEEAPSRTA